MAEMIVAVASVHELGYIHRHLKPDNILLDWEGVHSSFFIVDIWSTQKDGTCMVKPGPETSPCNWTPTWF
jgi:serine/threonine protein kinase